MSEIKSFGELIAELIRELSYCTADGRCDQEQTQAAREAIYYLYF